MSRRILKRITINRDDVAILRDQLLHVHTRNGDSIEIQFQRPSSARGKLCFGFDGGRGSRIPGPKKIGGLLARSDECRRDAETHARDRSEHCHKEEDIAVDGQIEICGTDARGEFVPTQEA